jgi:hypothetical protein
VVDDRLKLSSKRNLGFGTKFKEELRSFRSRISCGTFELENNVHEGDHFVRRTREMMYGLRHGDDRQ